MSSIKCPYCGKEIPEDLIAGAIENAQTTESVDDAPATNEIAVGECDEGSPTTEQETPFVVPLISEAPSESEAADEYDADDSDDDEEYLNIIKDCAIINVLAVLLFVGGIASLLLINEWLAAVMFLVAEIFALVPNEKLMKLCKAKNTSADKKTQNTIVKETRKRVKAKNNNFKFSFVIAYICLACLIVSFIVPVPLIGINSNNADNINSGSNNYDDVAVNGNVQGESDIIDERDEKVEATSFITRSNFEMYEVIKPYCKQIGYDVDSWVVDTNTKDCLVLFGPEHSTESQMVTVTDYMFIVQMNKKFFVSGQGNEGFFTVTGRGSEEEYIFGFVDVLLADCPEELKYTGQYLRDNYNDNVYHGTATFEKEGIIYQITYLPNTNGWLITLKLAEN